MRSCPFAKTASDPAAEDDQCQSPGVAGCSRQSGEGCTRAGGDGGAGRVVAEGVGFGDEAGFGGRGTQAVSSTALQSAVSARMRGGAAWARGFAFMPGVWNDTRPTSSA
ncbi:MAG: hypothetical protein P8Y58_06775 [Novosphingobium sp.]